MAAHKTSAGILGYLREPAVTSALYLLFSGLLGILIFSIAQSQNGFLGFLSLLGVCTMIALSSLLCGSLVGFLFGIPKTLQQDDVEPERRFAPNTNLEQISDWLTKILVGVGLTQLRNTPELVEFLADRVSAALDGTAVSRVFGVATILYFVIGGFLLGFIITRLYLPKAFQWAEAFNRIRAEVKEEVDRQTTQQDAIDARAISLTNVQLDPDRDVNTITGTEIQNLKDTIKKASLRTQAEIMEKTRTVRSSTWEDNKLWMARTIPIFEALVESDVQRRFHVYRGQLAYAYKDQLAPTRTQLEEAKRLLDEAIEIRGVASNRYLLYEFNRAICNILLDENYKHQQPSESAVRASIAADLQRVRESSYYSKILQNRNAFERSPVNSWCRLNGAQPFA